MKTFKQKITINYEWKRIDNDEIDSEHFEALEESALERIFDQMQDDMTNGNLHDAIPAVDGDPGDEIEYAGWWQMSTKCPRKRYEKESTVRTPAERRTI